MQTFEKLITFFYKNDFDKLTANLPPVNTIFLIARLMLMYIRAINKNQKQK